MTFTTPAQIRFELTTRIRERLLNQAWVQAESVQKFIGQHCKHREIGPLVKAQFQGHSFNAVLVSADIDFQAIHKILAASVKNATDLLEDRVNRNIAETDNLYEINLGIQNADLIEGVISGETAQGERFHIDVHMLWNYRYGENSANGVLTVYPQFRGSRQGAPMAGKPQKSKATAAKEEAKAQREAEKNIRRVALRAKFANAPERLARQCEKSIRDWGMDHPTAPEWAWIRDAARALTVEQLDEMFAQGSRTSGDLESDLERQYRNRVPVA